eukprot:scaffold5612_cov150-Amphora_coffeaeformis.AAC.4
MPRDKSSKLESSSGYKHEGGGAKSLNIIHAPGRYAVEESNEECRGISKRGPSATHSARGRVWRWKFVQDQKKKTLCSVQVRPRKQCWQEKIFSSARLSRNQTSWDRQLLVSPFTLGIERISR